MKRIATRDLMEWIRSSDRRPLVLRGARQVGKTWLVRDLAQRTDRTLIEINFEQDPRWGDCFVDNDPAAILGRIGLRLGRRIDPASSLLFLDEIQAFVSGLAQLRWFAELLPQLPVIAAGSLLEFALGSHEHSMPVGRIGFYNLDPLSFDEYLLAHGQELLLERLRAFAPGSVLEAVVHERASAWLERFSMVGGMPGIATMDLAGASSESIRDAQRQLVATYRADFAKYSGRLDTAVLDKVLLAAAHQLGQKFVYAKAATEAKQHQVKAALELLVKARLCQLVTFSAGNGVPLGAQANDKFRKVALLDVAMFHALIDTPARPIFPRFADLVPSARAQIAEQLTSQQLRALGSRQGDPQDLFYWQREGGRPGEVDHLLSSGGRVVPLELKSGAAGSMKSLHQFMFDKQLHLAVRVDTNPPSQVNLDVRTTQGDAVRYLLLSLPPYLLFHLEEVLARVSGPQ